MIIMSYNNINNGKLVRMESWTIEPVYRYIQDLSKYYRVGIDFNIVTPDSKYTLKLKRRS